MQQRIPERARAACCNWQFLARTFENLPLEFVSHSCPSSSRSVRATTGNYLIFRTLITTNIISTPRTWLGFLKLSGGGVSNCTCGLANRASRIVGGVNAEVNEYPWHVGLVSKGELWVLLSSLMYWVTGGSIVWCGGSLLNSRWVLTAATCTRGETTKILQVIFWHIYEFWMSMHIL